MNNKQLVLVVDIDGTVANISHRRPYVASKPKNWKAFNESMHLDTPYHDILQLIEFITRAGMPLVFASGRGEEQREVTEAWLKEHVTSVYGFNYQKLYMRPAKDSRQDYIIKLEILQQMRDDGYEPWMVIDDRSSVVQAWRSQGIRVLQCAEGNF